MIPVTSKGRFHVYSATVEFTTTYELPPDVDESAVLRAIRESTTANVSRLVEGNVFFPTGGQ